MSGLELLKTVAFIQLRIDDITSGDGLGQNSYLKFGPSWRYFGKPNTSNYLENPSQPEDFFSQNLLTREK